MSNMRRAYNDLYAQRNAAIQSAKAALEAKDTALYDEEMTKVGNMDAELQRYQDVIKAEEAFAAEKTFSDGEKRDIAEARAQDLLKGGAITFNTSEVKAVINSVLATGDIANPVGAGADIHDMLSGDAPLVDQVNVQDMTGLSGWEEAYVYTETEAEAGRTAGAAGSETTPVFGKVALAPYEVNVTSYVDRNVAKLTPTQYYNKIYTLAMKALRKKVQSLILNGDGASSPKMFGILNAADTQGRSMIQAISSVTALDAAALRALVLAYGEDDFVGPNARLITTKANLGTIAGIRGTNEKKAVFELTPQTANTGLIVDGGLAIAYDCLPAAAVGAKKVIYGDPMNYMLGLFGGYTIRVDESYKAAERMLTILGDCMVGGNVTVKNGFGVATLA